jgi:maltooligosyltrehalose trehalohydrolase
MIAESDLNDPRVIRSPEIGGFGLDAQWSDDFHHAAHALLTGERTGYYQDFGCLDDLAQAYRGGFVYTGQHSTFRRRRHGSPPRHDPGERFVVSIQNHDQVGNRAQGERLTALLSFPELKLSACVLLLSPYVPLLFMGEEYGETAPFQYFTSHSDSRLAEAVRKGRRAEFAAFGWKEGEIPDPQDETTFARSRLTRESCAGPENHALRDLYRDLLRLRRERPALRSLDRDRTDVTVHEQKRVMVVRRWRPGDEAIFVFAFGERDTPLTLPLSAGPWRTLIDTEDPRWRGGGSDVPRECEAGGAVDVVLRPRSCVLFVSSQGDL